jgi:hypothetical protein
MGSIPLPALHVAVPQPQENMLDQYARIQQIKAQQANQPLIQQELQQRVQQGQMQNQQSQREIDSQDAIMSAWSASNGDLGKAYEAAAKSGKALPQDLAKLRDAHVQMQSQALDLVKKQGDEAGRQAGLLSDAASAVNDAPPEARPAVWQAKLQQLHQAGVDMSQAPPQYPGDQAFGVFRLGLLSHATAVAEAKQKIENEKNIAETGKFDAQTQEVKGKLDPTSPLYAPSAASVALGTAPGAARIQANEVQQGAKKAAADAAARQPFEMALAKQRQALTQGDPKAAAQLMVDHDATLSELKSRGATPEFISKALFYAKQLSGGKYNAQEAEANFKVAQSPTNVAFFGSAKSLTEKGGTLDQLEDAAKSIPQNQFPVFNSLEDWTKEASGSGPLAHYASLVLGVADDYSKVMGGGQGSDTSRLQAANLVSKKLSTEGRAGAVSGIRGAVKSQITGRIGKNDIMQRMYGEDDAASGGTVLMRAPNGQTKPVPADQVEHYKQMGATVAQ